MPAQPPDQPPLLSPKAPMVDSLLAYLSAPLYPYTSKLPPIARRGRRTPNPKDVLVPQGYTVDVVATGFSAPVHCTFDEQGVCYVSECGHKIDSKPRIWKVDTRTGEKEVFFDLPDERWKQTGAFTGAVWHQGSLYFMNTDTLSRLRPDGSIEDLVTDLPGLGDHQSNHPTVGPDGKVYWGQGSATNTGIVGADNWAYEWLRHFHGFHDVPGQDITLAGRNYEYRNVLGNELETVRSGAYVPFGVETQPGEVVEGHVKCSGSILRCNPDGSELELVAWGLRNPYGTAFHPDGRLFCTEHGIDERSRRFIVGDLEDLYEIQDHAWYGWPDFASGIRLDDPYWGDSGRGREPVLAEHPDPNPPKPFVTFPPHAAPNGLDFCRDPTFGFEGDAFVALFGDLSPVTTRALTPRGYKVVRVDTRLGHVVDFAVNKIEGPASKLPHEGFERPSHCQFGPDGALYIVDWGQIEIAPEVGGIRMKEGSGVLWRIRRTEGTRGWAAPEPITVPLYAFQFAALVAGFLGLAGFAGWIANRLFTRRGGE